jgi:hypothetical protein
LRLNSSQNFQLIPLMANLCDIKVLTKGIESTVSVPTELTTTAASGQRIKACAIDQRLIWFLRWNIESFTPDEQLDTIAADARAVAQYRVAGVHEAEEREGAGDF